MDGVPMNFRNKTIVVIGGTSGINRGIAEAFASNGAKVAVASRSQSKVDDTIAALESAGAQAATGAAFDVRDPEAVSTGLAGFHEAFGDIDVLVSGAAGNFPALTARMSANAFKTVIDIDLMGTAHVMQAAYPFLRRPGASVINISAPQSYLAMEGQAHVCAAKAGIDQITRTLALEWGGEGIRVNSVVPGFIQDTEGTDRLAPTPQIKADIMADIPLGRFGTKHDMGNMCMFLGSDLASYVTGSVLTVDGGLSPRGSGWLGKQLGDMLRAMPDKPKS